MNLSVFSLGRQGGLQASLFRHVRSLSFYGGLGVVTVWTVLRHITNGVNFDIVGQVGITQQWSLGQHAGAQLGSTNYLLKMPFYWLINHMVFLTPHQKLLALALLFNLATFTAIFLLTEKILDFYRINARSWFYLAFFWLATISGNVFWLEYANSRNLEPAGGLLLVYLVLRHLLQPSYKLATILALCAGIVFFADPLQVFVIGLPICLYLVGKWFNNRKQRALVATLVPAGALVIGYAVSKFLFWLSIQLLPVSFLRIPAVPPDLSLHSLWTTTHATATNTLKIFGADFAKRPLGFNNVRGFLGFITLLGIMLLLVKLLAHRQADEKPKVLLLSIILMNYVVYIASGQAIAWETSRYLIMVPLACLLLVSLYAPDLVTWHVPRVQAAWLAVLVVCSLLVTGALIKSWPTRYSLDTYINAANLYMDSHAYTYGFAARQTAIPASYFDDYHHTLLPLICGSDHRLHFSNLFFDKSPFVTIHTAPKIPILIPGGGVQSDANVCSREDILRQFGAPETEQIVGAGMTAAVYNGPGVDLHKL